MSKFAKIKFVHKPRVSKLPYCVEGQAWDEITSVKAMASPDYREFGEGETIEEAKSAAASACMRAHILFMTASLSAAGILAALWCISLITAILKRTTREGQTPAP